MKPYGIELLLDLTGCDLNDLSRKKLEDYFVRLSDLIQMKRHGEPLFWEDHSGTPHLHGVSAIQFIETSCRCSGRCTSTYSPVRSSTSTPLSGSL